MSRSGYTDAVDDHWQLIRWRGAVKSALRGKRGQAFLREMLAALDAMPAKQLIQNELELPHGPVCAIGRVGRARGVDMSTIDPEDYEQIAELFGVSRALVQEIEHINDDDFCYRKETPEQRFERVRQWVVKQLERKASREHSGSGND
jgi:hypothetical protein